MVGQQVHINNGVVSIKDSGPVGPPGIPGPPGPPGDSEPFDLVVVGAATYDNGELKVLYSEDNDVPSARSLGYGPKKAASGSSVADIAVSISEFGALPGEENDIRESLSAAIAYVNLKGGGTVLIPPGLWYVGGETVVPSRTVIKGAGRNATRIKTLGTTMSVPGQENPNSYAVFQIRGTTSTSGNIVTEQVVISDLTIVGNADVETSIFYRPGSDQSEGIQLGHPNTGLGTYPGSGAYGVNDILIERCGFENIIGHAIQSFRATNVVVQNCHVQHCIKNGFNLSGRWIRILNNHFYDCWYAATECNASDLLIANNIVRSCRTGGINAIGNGSTVDPLLGVLGKRILVSNNIVDDCKYGIGFSASVVDSFIIGNFVMKAHQFGIQVIDNVSVDWRPARIVIANNTVSSSGKSTAMVVNNTTGEMTYPTNNTKFGIFVQGGAKITVQNNVILSGNEEGFLTNIGVQVGPNITYATTNPTGHIIKGNVLHDIGTYDYRSQGGVTVLHEIAQVNVNRVNLTGDGTFVPPPQQAWQTPSLTNSWAHVSSVGYCRYRRLGGSKVRVEFYVSGGSPGSSAFTLPEGYRPTNPAMFSVIADDGVGTFKPAIAQVQTNGDLTLIYSGPETRISGAIEIVVA